MSAVLIWIFWLVVSYCCCRLGIDDVTRATAAFFLGSGKTAAFMVPILSQICVRGREVMSQNSVLCDCSTSVSYHLVIYELQIVLEAELQMATCLLKFLTYSRISAVP